MDFTFKRLRQVVALAFVSKIGRNVNKCGQKETNAGNRSRATL
ncbi:hypothetical protein HMPREF3204_00502 [Gardnerella pickettii]|nr:hypothetical protein HMPREF3204_00502 [Gardnerella pickettii]